MPVSAVAPADQAAPSQPAQPSPAPGFADALAAEQATTADETGAGDDGASGASPLAQLPTVTLGQMVQAIVSGEAPVLEQTGQSGTGGAEAVAAAAASGDRPVEGRSGVGARILDAGEQYLGVPYVWGGTDPQVGFDCSGFVQQTFADLGVDLPRVSVDQSQAGQPVASMAEARPGDLVYWHGSGGSPNHIGIYAGEGEMLVAPSSGDVVRYQEISETPDRIRRVM